MSVVFPAISTRCLSCRMFSILCVELNLKNLMTVVAASICQLSWVGTYYQGKQMQEASCTHHPSRVRNYGVAFRNRRLLVQGNFKLEAHGQRCMACIQSGITVICSQLYLQGEIDGYCVYSLIEFFCSVILNFLYDFSGFQNVPCGGGRGGSQKRGGFLSLFSLPSCSTEVT